MTRIDKALDNLLIQSKGEIKSRIEELSFDVPINNSHAKCSCYFLKYDSNGNLRLKDLIEYIDEKIVEYAIPRKDIENARKYQEETNSPSKTISLKKKANALFTDLKKTGEGGEVLLYILVQEFLHLPQLISKMSLKTSGKVHYQGADGVHVSIDKKNNKLNLYWGESKMYQSLSTAIENCFKSLKGFLTDPYSYKSTQERDIQLITSQISDNIIDEELENFIVRYFDKDDDLSNDLVYKGLCFIGFDSEKYNTVIKRTDVLKKELAHELSIWYKTIEDKIAKVGDLELKEMHVFLMPFPSVEEFRKYYLEVIS